MANAPTLQALVKGLRAQHKFTPREGWRPASSQLIKSHDGIDELHSLDVAFAAANSCSPEQFWAILQEKQGAPLPDIYLDEYHEWQEDNNLDEMLRLIVASYIHDAIMRAVRRYHDYSPKEA